MSSENDPPKGQRFDLVYCERGDPVKDSPAMRERISVVFELLSGTLTRKDSSYYIGRIVHKELGVKFRREGYNGYYYDFEQLFGNEDIGVLLASLTIIWRAMPKGKHSEAWVAEIERIFREENTCYRIDDEGGVHYSPDGEYERNRAATFAALSGARYAATRAAFETIQADLNAQPPKYKHAIRSAFESNEIVFKLIFNQAQRLTEREIGNRLKPLLAQMFEGDKTEQEAVAHVADSFAKWVNAAHWYRHGQGDEEANEPDQKLAILMVSSGIGFLRLLAEVDRANQAASAED